MGIALSSSSRSVHESNEKDELCDAETVAARQRSFEFFESLDPGRASRWTALAYFMYKCSGGGVESARPIFRAALACCPDYAEVYSSWTTMELDDGGGGPSAARELYEEWRARSEADGGKKDDDDDRAAFMWTDYVLFEIDHGGAARARAVADAAVAACPRNAEVRAECVLAEVRLGDDARARAAFDRALADLADDAEGTRQFLLELRRHISPPKEDDGLCDAETVAARQRSFKFFESIDPGRAVRWTELAYFMYKCSGGGVESARPIFHAALECCPDYAEVYSSWITMELDVGGGGPSEARKRFEEWRARSEAAAGGGEDDDDRRAASLWYRYIMFEIDHGDAARARALADAAVAACPRNAEVRAECVLAEVRLGDDARARAAFDRALADLADDEEGTREFLLELRRGAAYLSDKWFGGCLNFCRGWWFRPSRWWEQI